MTEAVIVAAARTPIGRANKGSLVDCRPDDLSATIVKATLAKVPGLDPKVVEDVIWGCGQPAGESGYNIARVVSILAGIIAFWYTGMTTLVLLICVIGAVSGATTSFAPFHWGNARKTECAGAAKRSICPSRSAGHAIRFRSR